MIESALFRDGFELKRGKGATRLYRHPDGRRVVLHGHRAGQILSIGALREVLAGEARWDEGDLKRLRLLS